MDNETQKAIDFYNREIRKDLVEIETEKAKFINKIKNGLGEKINDFNTYKKPEPGFWKKITTKIKKLFRYL